MEEWRDIKGYEGIYQVSSYGRVRSLDRKKVVPLQGNPVVTIRGCILKPRESHEYLQVKLCNDGVYKRYQVHRLVAEAFIPNHNNLPQVNHKDENKLNNNVQNLEWCTPSYNSTYGTIKQRRKEKRGVHVFQYSKDGELIKEHASLTDAAIAVNGQRNHIRQVCKGERKYAHGYVWRFVS